METVVANFSGKPRKESLHGRDYLVAKLTLIVPGVLNGSNGPILYPAEEVSKAPWTWNHTPIVVYHPTGPDGKPVSAKSPTVLNKQGIGFVFDGDFSTKLEAYGWFDQTLTQNYDKGLEERHRIWPRLEKGEPIELSTGLGLEPVEVPAGTVHNGTPYKYTSKNYVPDHLAVLPDQVGACSIKDGCGVNNASTTPDDKLEKMNLWQKLTKLVWGETTPPTITNAGQQPSHDEIRRQLSEQLRERFSKKASMFGMGSDEGYMMMPYVLSVYDKEVIYEYDGLTYKLSYSTDLRSSKITLSSEAPKQVKKVVTYKTVTNGEGVTSRQEQTDFVQCEEVTVDRTATINYLTANCSCWKGKEAELNKLEDATLNTLKDGVVVPTPVPTPTPTPAPAPVAVVAPVNNTPTPPRLTPEEAEDLAFARAEKNRQKEASVARLTANVSDPVQKKAHSDWLMQKPLDELRSLASLIPPPPPPVVDSFGLPPFLQGNQAPQDYGLSNPPAGGVQNQAGDDEEVLPILNIEWGQGTDTPTQRKKA